ncbi:MAG: 4a-hydroxytetrahydrobiopterin dehydratase [Aeromicrobium sp.]|uniref:4a-hydroxytetrahydrobiopterin dehydratase n=1 Tax=Aeromicrobium sp. TaxID=1871063 RepID=UPI003C3D6A6D
MSDDKTVMNGPQIEAEALGDWRPLLGRLMARFRTGDFRTGLELVRRTAEAAEAANHHPDLELTYPTVTVRLSSHDVGGITARDIRLAREISQIAADLAAEADTDGLAVVELALDTDDIDLIRPFWSAVLAVEPGEAHDDLVDPTGQVPAVWFQQTEPGTCGGGDVAQRWHLDLRVPPEQVQPRIDAALAAGGTLSSDQFAPAFWVLADPQGNKICLTTWQDRQRA